jgi:hypothetical protein
MAVLAGVLLLAATESAAVGRCEARKLQAAGWYWSCRLGVDAEAARHGGIFLDFQRCDASFAQVEGVRHLLGHDSPLDTSATFALAARDGTILWEKDMPAPMFGAMTYVNGVVYQGTIDGTVHALSARDGTDLWSDTPGGGIAGGFSVSHGTLYVGLGFWFMAPPATPNGGFAAYSIPLDH